MEGNRGRSKHRPGSIGQPIVFGIHEHGLERGLHWFGPHDSESNRMRRSLSERFEENAGRLLKIY
ncbi:hypothetical protein Enr13x_43710 [Stieleria neptunia]|uniref:Uncharacterized protein n=1 Tax=Stieleria neptunia TaxID=2527979 RepID=A0A518HUH7_9BACT|nr:hypothetical protein Enr13x_43710 [Stieleria neptunia]